MSTFRHSIAIGSPDGSRFEEIEALVDTGATLTVVPASLLRQIGVEPLRMQAFVLADGRRVEYPIGRVEVAVEGRSTPTLGVFGPEDVTATLGVVVLESVGLTIDPPHLRLVPTPGLLL